MNKTRILLGAALSLVVALGVSAVAVGCGDPQSEPQTYTLAYEKGTDENGTVPETKSYAAGETVTLASADTFTKDNYTFTKWLDGAAEYDAGASFTMPERNVTLKAKWQENEPVSDPSSDKLVLGENVYTLGADDVDENGELGRTISFSGKADTNYTVEIEFEALGSTVCVWSSEEAYADGEEALLDGDKSGTVLTTDGGGTLSLYLNGWTYNAENYEADDFTVTITVTEGAHLQYSIAFYEDENSQTTNVYFDITWGNTFNQEFAGDDSVEFPVGPQKEGYTFVGWFDEAGVEFTADTVVKSEKSLIAKFVCSGDGKTELSVGENELVLGANDVDFMDYFYREVIFTGEPNTNYTFTQSFPANVGYPDLVVFLDELDGVQPFEMEDEVVLKTSDEGEILFVLSGSKFIPNEYKQDNETIRLNIVKGGIVQYNVMFFESVRFIGPNGNIGEIITVNENETVSEESFPEYPSTSIPQGYEFVGWYIAVQQGMGPMSPWVVTNREFTSATEVTANLMVVGVTCFEGSGGNFFSAVDQETAEQKFVLGTDDVKGNEQYRVVTFSGKPDTNYTFTQILPEGVYYSDLVVFLTQIDGKQPFEESDEVVLKTTPQGMIIFVLYHAGLYSPASYVEDDVTVTLSVQEGGTIEYTVAFYENTDMIGMPRSFIDFFVIEENGTISADDIPDFPVNRLPANKVFAGWYIAEAQQSGYMVIWTVTDTPFTSETVITSDTMVVAKFEDETPAETTVNALTADGLTNTLAGYPQYIKKGETLTVTGDVELTDVTVNSNGIFVSLSNGGSAYVMPAYHNWVYNSQSSQQENAAMNFMISKAEYGFTDSVSGGVWDNYNAMLLKKTCAVK